MTNREIEDVSALLLRRAGSCATAEAIADTAASIWREFEGALAPFFGRGLVGLLYDETLSLARPTYAWLREAQAKPPRMDLDGLRPVLAQQPPATAMAAAGFMLEAFCGLLERLIGQALTGRMLQSVFDSAEA